MWDQIRDNFPIGEWLAGYDRQDLQRDAIAGLTVGIMLVPQSMAYAVLAGMPPIYGLYASLVPLLIYPLLGSSRHLAIGVIAIDMLVISAGVSGMAEPGSSRYVALVVLLTAFVGLLQMIMASAQMGFLASLLSRPVIAGFTAAAALIICFSQLGNLLGVDLPHSEYIYVLVQSAATHLDQVHYLSLGVGLGSIALIIGVGRWVPALPGALAVVLLSTFLSWMLGLRHMGVHIVGSIPRGLPSFDLPYVGWADFRDLLPTAVTLALVQFMSIISLGRAFASRHRYSIRPNWELLAVGAANFLGSFFRSIPVSSSFSRSAVNERSGARSPLANIFSAGLVALTLLVLTPIFSFIPMPALAAIIIVAAFGLIDLEEMKYLFRVKERDGYLALFTFGTTLLVGIQEGILLGIGASTVAVLYRLSRPFVAELGHVPGTHSFRNIRRFPEAMTLEGLLILRVDADFSFFNASFFKDFVLEKSREEGEEVRAVIIDGTSINDLDTTAIEVLEEIIAILQGWDIEVYISGLKGQVRDVLQHSGLYELVPENRFQTSVNRAVKRILEQWDEEEGGEHQRLEKYTSDAEQEVPPEVRSPNDKHVEPKPHL